MSDKKMKYTVIAGKHRNEDGSYTHQGGIVEMSPETVKRFPNKFAPVMAPVAADGVSTTEISTTSEAPAATPAPAAAAAPAKK